MRIQLTKAAYLTPVFLLLAATAALTGCVTPGVSGLSAPISSPATTVTIPPVTVTVTADPASPPVTSTTIQSQSALSGFGQVIARVRPSVVAITTEATTMGFFGTSFTEQGAGSGWIISQDGLIVTNNHVVEGANTISVTLEDGRSFTADSVHTDSISDLAIIRIKAEGLPALQVGDSSKLQAGDWVVAIGNSLGMGISASKGIVSALGVSLSVSAGQTLSGLIQTDAAINPGNSGGPLVNLAGEVVGINSAKVSQVGVEGMGYAIGVNEAKPIINDLIKNGYVVRPYLGASLYTVDQYVTRRYRLAVSQGVLITGIASSSPAEKAKLQPGDVITAIDDKPVNDEATLNQVINSAQVGQKVKITYWRGKTQNTVEVTLTQSPPVGQ